MRSSHIFEIRLGQPFAGAGPSLAYRRELYERVGGFGDLAHRISGDDVLLIQLIAQKTTAKIRFMSESDAAVFTDTETTWTSFYNQRQRWASNSGIQWRLNKKFFIFLGLVFLANVLVVTVPVIALAASAPMPLWVAWLFFVIIKGTSEFCLLRVGAELFERPAQLSFYPKWFVTHPIYTLVMAIAGHVGKIRWK